MVGLLEAYPITKVRLVVMVLVIIGISLDQSKGGPRIEDENIFFTDKAFTLRIVVFIFLLLKKS